MSSLGRAESCALSTLEAVLRVVHRLADEPWQPSAEADPIPFDEGRALLRRNTDALLGPAPKCAVRIMVTMPKDDYALVRDLVAGGMDCMRINCAHDDRDVWGRSSTGLWQDRLFDSAKPI